MTSRKDNSPMLAFAAAGRYRVLFSIYLGVIALVLCVEGVANLRSMGEWEMGDWLINYSAGFVRRGLNGEVAMRAGHLLHISPAALILILQLGCYTLLLLSVHHLVARSSWRYWVPLTLFSPATLGFPVLNWGGAFRKEILLLAGLGGLLLMLRRPFGGAVQALYTSLLAVVCVLSHEALLVFLVYLFAAMAIGLDSIVRACRISLAPALAAFVAAIEVDHHRGNQEAARTICRSLGYTFSGELPAPCQGGIAYLGRDQASVRQDVIWYVHSFHFADIYPLVTLLAILPVVLGFIALWHGRHNRRPLLVLAATASISIAASSVLFFYALDWGRWIYIHVVCISMLLLFIDYRQPRASGLANFAREPESKGTMTKVALACGLLLFATCWDLPYVGGYPLRFGYAGLLALLAHAIPG